MSADIDPADPASAASVATIELLQRHSLSTLVLGELQRKIISGELHAGAKLNEADIAVRMRVSRGPVREAFRALEQSGLVRTEKNRGVFVRELSLSEADDIYEVRAALEGLIGRLAARRIDDDALRRLRGALARMRAASRERDAATFLAQNIAFHDVLAVAAGNRALLLQYRRVVDELKLFRHASLSINAKNMVASSRDHAAIFDAVAAGDEALASQRQFDHVLDSRERLHAALGRRGAAALKAAH